MRLLKLYISASLLAAAVSLSVAQEASRSAYFLDGYTFRHELNPAFGGEYNYVSMPALGNFGLAMQSNVGVNTFLYKTPAGSPYGLTTFMSPTVSASDFLGKLKCRNNINADLNMTLLSGGFFGAGGFNTVSVGVHTDLGVSIPREFLRFMKLGQTDGDTQYHIDGLRVDASAYAELAYGHSHKINGKLSVGGKFKVLIGLANANAHIDRMDIRLSDNVWQIDARGKVAMSAGNGLRVPTYRETGHHYDLPADADLIDWGEIDYDHFGVAGYGFGFDLGAAYKLIPDLELSFAVNDLGYMSWTHAVYGKTGNTTWTFDGFQDVAIKDTQDRYQDDKLSAQWDRIRDDLEDVAELHRTRNGGSYCRSLRTTLRFGAEYKMPFYRNLTVAALYSGHLAGAFSWNEGRVYANIKPARWFDATANYGISNYGSSFGWMLNFHPRGFNFFVGTDHQFFRITPQVLPVGRANMSVNMGVNFTFGGPAKEQAKK